MNCTHFRIYFVAVIAFLAGACQKGKSKTPKKSEVVVTETQKPVENRPVTSQILEDSSKKIKLQEINLQKEIDAIKINEIQFVNFSSTSKFRYKTAKETQNAQINFRIKRDSLIWFSISGFGIEAVRGIVTQDSLIAIDKLHREYYKFDFKSLSQSFNFELNFQILQSLVLGNLPLKKRGKNKFVKKENDYYLIRQEEGEVQLDNYIGENNRKLRRLLVTSNKNVESKMQMNFNDFQMIQNHIFPFESLITVDYKSKSDNNTYETVVELSHKKVEFDNPNLNFPFVIPPKYTPKN